MNKDLLQKVMRELNCREEDLIWSEYCNNPETCYHCEDGTIKCEQGYWVKK